MIIARMSSNPDSSMAAVFLNNAQDPHLISYVENLTFCPFGYSYSRCFHSTCSDWDNTTETAVCSLNFYDNYCHKKSSKHETLVSTVSLWTKFFRTAAQTINGVLLRCRYLGRWLTAAVAARAVGCLTLPEFPSKSTARLHRPIVSWSSVRVSNSRLHRCMWSPNRTRWKACITTTSSIHCFLETHGSLIGIKG